MDDQLGALTSTRFHQDIDNLVAPVREFLDDASAEDVRGLVSNIDRFLAATSPADVPAAMAALGSRVRLGGRPQAYIAWLQEIRLAAALRLERTSSGRLARTDVRPTLEVLVDDIDEELTACGEVLVGHFFWFLRGAERELTEPQMQDLSERAYAIVRQRHRTRLVWSAWPTDLATATPADESTLLEFDLDPDGPVGTPILALVLDG